MELLLVRAPLLGDDLEVALLASGAGVRRLEPTDIGLDLLNAAKNDGIAGLLSVNHSPQVALLCSLAGLPYVSWTIDPLPYRRWEILGGTDLSLTTLFVHRKALVEPLRAMGYREVHWMPLACAERRWNDPVEGRRGDRGALFVGSSLLDEREIFVDSMVRWGVGDALQGIDAALQGIAKACLWDRSFHGFLRDLSAVPKSLAEALPAVDRMDLAEALDAGLAWHFRRELVAIICSAGVEVKGDGGWEESARRNWTGPLRNGREMTQAYATASVNLDVPRLHQREIATLRAFDVLGSGGLLACETGTELDELFEPGEQFLSWSDERDLRAILEASVGHDPSLDRIAAAGREAVVAGHSLGNRAARILKRFGG